MSAKDTSPPTLAEQIGWISGWIDKSHAHGRKQETADFEAVKASLESISTLHSQIDGLMKRLLKSEANERRYLWLRSGGPGTGLYVADAEREWVEVDGEELDELVDDALSVQGGGDG